MAKLGVPRRGAGHPGSFMGAMAASIGGPGPEIGPAGVSSRWRGGRGSVRLYRKMRAGCFKQGIVPYVSI